MPAALLDFNFLTILNLFVIILYPATTPYRKAAYDAVSIIMIILTIIAVVLDVFYLVLKAMGKI
jgi:uncharacterized membrane protein